MKCTVCNSTGFADGQCIGCGVLVEDMPPAKQWVWDEKTDGTAAPVPGVPGGGMAPIEKSERAYHGSRSNGEW